MDSLEKSLKTLNPFSLHKVKQLQNFLSMTHEGVQQYVIFMIGEQVLLVKVWEESLNADILSKVWLMTPQ